MFTHLRSVLLASSTALCTLLTTPVAQAQTPVTIGTGTAAASTNALLSTSTTTNKYSRTITIYTAAELLAAGARAGTITKIGWYKDGTGEYTTNDAEMTILMKNNTTGMLSGDPVTWTSEIVGATTVYTNAALSLPTGTGWKTFTLTTPFVWNGTSNVEVLVDWFRNSAPTGSINWQYTPVVTTSGLHATQVNSVAVPTIRYAPNRPNIQFTFSIATAARPEQGLSEGVQVSPNPFGGQLTVQLTNPGRQAIETTLTDALGRVQHRQTLAATEASHTLQFSPALASGVYFLTLSNGTQRQTVRVLHQ